MESAQYVSCYLSAYDFRTVPLYWITVGQISLKINLPIKSNSKIKEGCDLDM